MIQRIAFLFVLGFLAACASQETVDSPQANAPEVSTTPQVEAEARPLYAAAEKAFEAKNYDSALRLFSQIRSKFPRGRAAAYASYRLGIIHYYRENYAPAAKEFETFIGKMPQSELTFDATYNWAASEHQLRRNDRAYQILSKMKIAQVQEQGPKRAETVYQLTARVATELRLPATAIAAYALQLQLPLEEGVRLGVESKVDEQLGQISSSQKLTELLSEVNEPTTRRKIETRLAALSPSPNTSPVASPNSPLSSVVPVPTAIPAVPTVLPSGGTSGSVSSIGVVLPLSGKWAAYGKRALDAILLAANTFGESGSDFKIYVRDTKNNPITAASAVDDLYNQHQVMAIIGPISFKEASAVAERAQAHGLPNISLASKEGLSEKSPYIFQTGLAPNVQLENLVRIAITEKGYKRFAILAPDNSFGKDMANSFWDLVSAQGATVSAYRLYDPKEQDFQDAIREMVGLKDLKYRKLEATKLADYVKEIVAKTKKEPKVQLSPIIDFDALFVPDSPKTVTQVAASMNYFDASSVPLLGTTEWNNDQFFRRGSQLIKSALFPAGLYLNSQNSMTQEFVRNYQRAYSVAPDLLAAQSYEAMALLGQAIHQSGSDDRNQLANTLAVTKGFSSPLGALSFDGTRLGRRKLSVLSLENGNTVSEF